LEPRGLRSVSAPRCCAFSAYCYLPPLAGLCGLLVIASGSDSPSGCHDCAEYGGVDYYAFGFPCLPFRPSGSSERLSGFSPVAFVKRRMGRDRRDCGRAATGYVPGGVCTYAALTRCDTGRHELTRRLPRVPREAAQEAARRHATTPSGMTEDGHGVGPETCASPADPRAPYRAPFLDPRNATSGCDACDL
jgi:hypothetical protein